MKYFTLLLTLMIFASCESSAPIPADLDGFESVSVPGSNVTKVFKSELGKKIAEEGFILDGTKHGMWTTYHPESKVKSMTNYIDGKKNGIHIEMTNRGQIELMAHYLNDVLHGDYAKYRFGRPQEEMTYVNGELDGEMRIYFNSGGKLQKLITYKDGVQDGPLKFYDEEGNVTVEYEYINGEKVSGGIIEK